MRAFLVGFFALSVVAACAGLAFCGPFFGSRWRCGPNGCALAPAPSPSVSWDTPGATMGASSSISPPMTPSSSSSTTTAGALAPAHELGGVDRSTGCGSKDGFQLGGIPVERNALIQGELNLPEDAGRPYVVVVGPESWRERQRKLLELHGVDHVAHVVAYDESQWQAKGVGYGPGVWFVGARGADGKAPVQALESDLEGKGVILEKWAEALRKPDGIIDRKLIPSLKRAVDPSAIVYDKVRPYLAGGLGAAAWVALALAFSKRKER